MSETDAFVAANPVQDPALQDPSLFERIQNRFASIGNLGEFMLQKAAEHPVIATAAATLVAAEAPGAAIARPVNEGTVNTPSLAASANSQPSQLNAQTVIGKIHRTLLSYSGDYPQGNSNRRAKYNGKWYFVDKIFPLSAHLEPSSGGFKGDCKNPYYPSFEYFEVNQNGMSFHDCGPFPPNNHSSSKGEFQPQLNRIGNYIKSAAGRSNPAQQTSRVTASRRKVVATYQCSGAHTGITGEVDKIVFSRPTKSSTKPKTTLTRSQITDC